METYKKFYNGILKYSILLLFIMFISARMQASPPMRKINKCNTFNVYIKVAKHKRICTKEVSVDDYAFFCYIMRQYYGEYSEKYLSIIPDTITFKRVYGYSFPLKGNEARYDGESFHQYIQRLMCTPMSIISRQQAEAYCQWMEFGVGKERQSSKWHYSLPAEADYERIVKKAKLTTQHPLELMEKKKYVLTGITDNVAEYTQGGKIVKGGASKDLTFCDIDDVCNIETPIGFRLLIVRKK